MKFPKIQKLNQSTLGDRLSNQRARVALGETNSVDDCLVCAKPVWISCFFDGTGNNFYADGDGITDPETTKYSNIAKLFRFAHPRDNNKPRFYNLYAPGVGTPFPEIGDSGDSIDKAIGMACAGKGQARIDWMMRELTLRVAKHMPKVSQINVAIFGFSRGAALARSFVHRLAKECSVMGGDLLWTKHGNSIVGGGSPPKLVIYYLGILDTVASVGFGGSRSERYVRNLAPGLLTILPGGIIIGPVSQGLLAEADKGGHYGWATDISIPSYVRHCDHYMAAHEVREKFPSDSTRINKVLPPNVNEVLYPGMHSDIGGGYQHDSQEGRTNMLANIALCNLYFSAYGHGVPFRSPEEILATAPGLFEISDDMEQCFNNYLSLLPQYSTLEAGVVAHMRTYYHWRWGRTTRLKSGTLSPSSGIDPWMKITDKEWEEDVVSIAKAKTGRFRSSVYHFEEDVFAAWKGMLRKKLKPEQLQLFDRFFDKYVHDSIAGFKNQMSDASMDLFECSRWARNRIYFLGKNSAKKCLYWQYARWNTEYTDAEMQAANMHDASDKASA